MKAELDNYNLHTFSAQYYGQNVLVFNYDESYLHQVENVHWEEILLGEKAYLLLKSISNITEEHLLVCYHTHSAIIAYDYTMDFKDALTCAKHWFNHGGIDDLEKFTLLTDYLRSEGYAVRWRDLSVDEMIEGGWIKLMPHA